MELNELNHDQFIEYSELETKKREIEKRQLQLKPLLVEQISQMGHTIEVKGIGNFYVSSRPRWQFTEELMDAKAELTKRENTEIAEGKATEIPGVPFLVFKPDVAVSE